VYYFQDPCGLINLYVLYGKRNNALLVIHFALKENLVRKKCLPSQLGWPGNRDYMHGEFSARLAGIATPGSQLGGLRFFHVIAKLIFSVFNRRAEIPANRATQPASCNQPLN